MESIVAKLRPKDEGKDGSFVGKVSKAQADPDPQNRSEGEITFNFIGDEDKIIKAKVFLSTEDFSKACEALDKGLNVKVSGRLKTSGKTKTIENPNFELLS
jgi:tRNA(Ile2) C34 agmatinyltransferase TiaS